MSNKNLIGLCLLACLGLIGCSEETEDRFNHAGNATAQGLESSGRDVQRATGQAAQATGNTLQQQGAQMESEANRAAAEAARQQAAQQAAEGNAERNNGAQ